MSDLSFNMVCVVLWCGVVVFNWHPVLMVAGMLVGLTNGVLSFRRPLERTTNKAMHAFWFIAAIVTMSIGLKAVWKSHDDKKPYKANLYTLHSMIGLAAVVLVSQNFVLGMLNFVSPLMSDMVKKVYKPNHIFLGICALVMAVMAIVTGSANSTYPHVIASFLTFYLIFVWDLRCAREEWIQLMWVYGR